MSEKLSTHDYLTKLMNGDIALIGCKREHELGHVTVGHHSFEKTSWEDGLRKVVDIIDPQAYIGYKCVIYSNPGPSFEFVIGEEFLEGDGTEALVKALSPEGVRWLRRKITKN